MTMYTIYCKDCIPSSFEFNIPEDLGLKMANYLKYGIPSFVILCLEWWSYGILTFYSGWISVSSQATNTIMINIEDLFSDVAQAMGFASATLVGECLGAEKHQAALKATKATIYLATGLCIVYSVGILYFKKELFSFYSDDASLIDHYMMVIGLFVLQLAFEIYHSAFVGVITGMGYQAVATFCDVFAYWGVMLPFCYLFAFVLGYGYQGVWMGVPMGTFTGAVIYSVIIYRKMNTIFKIQAQC